MSLNQTRLYLNSDPDVFADGVETADHVEFHILNCLVFHMIMVGPPSEIFLIDHI